MSGGEQVPVIARYAIEERLGEGAVAVVYRARDRELGRDVAVKVLKLVAGFHEKLRQRFQREARAAALISHPNVVAVHDVGESDGRMYLVMELVRGRSFQEVLARKHLDLPALVGILEKVGHGVAAAHEKGIVHRDVKPANILVPDDGEPKVGDFGLAHLADSQTDLTATGVVLGTPMYMAPEQVRGDSEKIVPATDVFALGAILYEILTGRPPFAGDTVAEVYRRISTEEPPRPRTLASAAPRDLEVIALKALEKDPALRYAHAGEFADDLRRYLDGVPIRARAAGPARRLARRLARHPLATAASVLALAALTSASLWIAGSRRAAAEYRAAHGAGIEDWNRAARTAAGESDRPAAGEIARKAAGWFERAAAADPARAEPWMWIGRCRLLAGDEAAAEAAFSEALQRDPSYSLARFERGKYYLGKYASLRPPPTVRLVGGRVWFARPDPESPEARAFLDRGREDLRAAERAGGVSEAERQYLTGALAYGEGRYDDAARTMLSYATANPWDARALAILGHALFFTGQLKEADEQLTRALRIEERAVWRRVRGDVRCGLGRFRDAVSDYTIVLRLEPDNADVYCSRGLARHAVARWEDALDDFARALKLHPGFARAYNNRGALHLARRDYPKAERDFREAVFHDPVYADAYNNLGSALLLEGEVDEAIRELTTAVGLAPDASEAYFNRGLAWKAKGEPARATDDFRRALAHDALNPEAYLRLAQCLYETGDRPAAVEQIKRALELAPSGWTHREASERLLKEWTSGK